MFDKILLRSHIHCVRVISNIIVFIIFSFSFLVELMKLWKPQKALEAFSFGEEVHLNVFALQASRGLWKECYYF